MSNSCIASVVLVKIVVKNVGKGGKGDHSHSDVSARKKYACFPGLYEAVCVLKGPQLILHPWHSSQGGPGCQEPSASFS